MSITAESKDALIKEFGLAPNDTGSTVRQVVMLTQRIKNLTGHVKINKKDFASTRGLTMLVGQRRRLLNYLKKTDSTQFISLIHKLGLKK